MITLRTNLQVSTAERSQSDHFGQVLPLAGTDYQNPAAPFDGGRS